MEQDQNKPRGMTSILLVYLILTTGIISQFIPFHSLQILGFILFPASLFIAWILRRNADPDSLIFNHMLYISRTIWIWSLLLSVAVPVAGYWVYLGGDHSAIKGLVDDMFSGTSYSEDELLGLFMQYMKTNMIVLLSAAFVCILPTVMYIVYRLSKGISRAIRGYRIANPRAWL